MSAGALQADNDETVVHPGDFANQKLSHLKSLYSSDGVPAYPADLLC